MSTSTLVAANSRKLLASVSSVSALSAAGWTSAGVVSSAADGSSAVCSVRVCSVVSGDGWTAHAVVGSRLRVMTSAMKSDTIRFFTPLFLLLQYICLGRVAASYEPRHLVA